MIVKDNKEYWYATETLIKQITEGECLRCKGKLKEKDIKETIKEEKYDEAGTCKKCRKK